MKKISDLYRKFSELPVSEESFRNENPISVGTKLANMFGGIVPGNTAIVNIAVGYAIWRRDSRRSGNLYAVSALVVCDLYFNPSDTPPKLKLIHLYLVNNKVRTTRCPCFWLRRP